jgi:glycosyltransferase involved in cell wall biosynthesis
VDHVAAELGDVSFVLIGPDAMARKRLTPRANLHLLGSRPYESLPGYLRGADVGLIPFDVKGHPSLVHNVHPLKLYEYLASGLPVVAARWHELERLDSPAVLCDTQSEQVEAIQAVLSSPRDRSAGHTFAKAANWPGRLAEMLRALN